MSARLAAPKGGRIAARCGGGRLVNAACLGAARASGGPR
jgi:hypothetical protein